MKVIQAMWNNQNKKTPDAESDDDVNENQVEINDSNIDEGDVDDQSTGGENKTNNEMKKLKDNEIPPENWSWKGYLAWYLHGCMAPKAKQLAIFDTSKYKLRILSCLTIKMFLTTCYYLQMIKPSPK